MSSASTGLGETVASLLSSDRYGQVESSERCYALTRNCPVTLADTSALSECAQNGKCSVSQSRVLVLRKLSVFRTCEVMRWAQGTHVQSMATRHSGSE